MDMITFTINLMFLVVFAGSLLGSMLFFYFKKPYWLAMGYIITCALILLFASPIASWLMVTAS
jgi:hypothetical protein